MLAFLHSAGLRVYKYAAFVALFATFAPLAFVRAQEYFGQIDLFLIRVNGFINNILVPLVFTVSLGFFIYGMFRYFIYGADNDGDREKGQTLMIWGVVGFVLMVSIWGIVNLLATGLFTGIDSRTPTLPGVPTL